MNQSKPDRDYMPCSVARLYSEIQGIPLSESYPLLGLENCPICKKAGLKPEFYPYCSSAHWKEDNRKQAWIDLTCDECAISFKRLISKVRAQSKNTAYGQSEGINHIFCNKKCLGVWAARNHGFATRPQDIHNNVKQEFCGRGHPMKGDNLYLYKTKTGQTRRHCRICNRARQREYYKRLKLARDDSGDRAEKYEENEAK